MGLAVVVYACNGFFAYLLIGVLDSKTFSPADSALIFAFLWPKVILLSVAGGACIAVGIRDWHGNVRRTLLLKLLDAHQKEIV